MFYILSDAQVLKSDFHGASVEVIRSRCFSLVGLKGVVIQETFSTFKVAVNSNETKIKSTAIFIYIFFIV